jgi:hypothetical protein
MLENMCLVKFSHSPTLQTPKEVMDAFERGITKWVETTTEGKKLWDYSSEDLNIGDMIGLDQNEELNKLLISQGIISWKPTYQLIEKEEYSYDKILANPSFSN